MNLEKCSSSFAFCIGPAGGWAAPPRLPLPTLLTMFALVGALSACGGGGGGDSAPAPAPAPTPISAPAPAAPVPVPAPVAAVALQPAGPTPTLTAADCQLLNDEAAAEAALQINGDDMQQVADILKRTSPGHGYQVFARAPSFVIWWVRNQGSISMATIGAAVHESNHSIDGGFHSTSVCGVKAAEFLLDGNVNVTQLVPGQTELYGIVAETIPAQFQSTDRYPIYITQNGETKGDEFSTLLEELNAYSGGSEFEIGFLSDPIYSTSSLAVDGDFNSGGMVDFMMYLVSYLKAARLNHPSTYASIQGEPETINYIQKLWNRAETNLAALYPYTTFAGGGQVVNKDEIAATYSADFIGELDALGITHQPLSAWQATYLH